MITIHKESKVTTLEAYSVRVIDGDTVEIMGEVWENIYIKAKVRINGVDTPELSTIAGKLIKQEVVKKLNGKSATIVYVESDKYSGRFVGDVLIGSGRESLAKWLFEKGYCKTYDGGTKSKWTDDELNRIVKSIPVTMFELSTEIAYTEQ